MKNILVFLRSFAKFLSCNGDPVKEAGEANEGKADRWYPDRALVQERLSAFHIQYYLSIKRLTSSFSSSSSCSSLATRSSSSALPGCVTTVVSSSISSSKADPLNRCI